MTTSTVLVQMTLKFATGLRRWKDWRFEALKSHICPLGHLWNTRGIQKLCSLTQLTTRYVHHILSFSTNKMHMLQHFSKAPIM